jgi:hypothetical protein
MASGSLSAKTRCSSPTGVNAEITPELVPHHRTPGNAIDPSNHDLVPMFVMSRNPQSQSHVLDSYDDQAP